MNYPDQLTPVEDAIRQERHHQDSKWGEQNHPPQGWLLILMEEVGETSKVVLEGGSIEDYEKEMTQVAAVAVAALESLHRNRGGK